MKTFSIRVLIYGKWETLRNEVPLSNDMPRDHIHMALTELYLYSNNFDHIKDVEVVVTEFVKATDSEGNELSWEERVDTNYAWGDTDYEHFTDFHQSILSKKAFKF